MNENNINNINNINKIILKFNGNAINPDLKKLFEELKDLCNTQHYILYSLELLYKKNKLTTQIDSLKNILIISNNKFNKDYLEEYKSIIEKNIEETFIECMENFTYYTLRFNKMKSIRKLNVNVNKSIKLKENIIENCKSYINKIIMFRKKLTKKKNEVNELRAKFYEAQVLEPNTKEKEIKKIRKIIKIENPEIVVPNRRKISHREINVENEIKRREIENPEIVVPNRRKISHQKINVENEIKRREIENPEIVVPNRRKISHQKINVENQIKRREIENPEIVVPNRRKISHQKINVENEIKRRNPEIFVPNTRKISHREIKVDEIPQNFNISKNWTEITKIKKSDRKTSNISTIFPNLDLLPAKKTYNFKNIEVKHNIENKLKIKFIKKPSGLYAETYYNGFLLCHISFHFKEEMSNSPMHLTQHENKNRVKKTIETTVDPKTGEIKKKPKENIDKIKATNKYKEYIKFIDKHSGNELFFGQIKLEISKNTSNNEEPFKIIKKKNEPGLSLLQGIIIKITTKALNKLYKEYIKNI